MKLFSSVFFLLLSLNVFSQNYLKVIKVNGDIKNQSQQEKLERGQKLFPDDKVYFNSSKDHAILISTSGQRFILSPNTGKTKKTSSRIASVKNAIINIRNYAATNKEGFYAGKINDLDNYLGDRKFVFLGSVYKIPLSQKIYPLNSNKFFVYSYKYKGENVHKKLAFKNDTLIFKLRALHSKNGKFYSPEDIEKVELFYHNANKNTTKLITTFNPLFLNTATLLKELKLQAFILKKAGNKKGVIIADLLDYVKDHYGKIDPWKFKKLLNSKWHQIIGSDK